MAQCRRNTPTPFPSRTLAELIREQFAPAALGLACALPLAAGAQAAPDAPEQKEKSETTLPEVKVKSAIDQLYDLPT